METLRAGGRGRLADSYCMTRSYCMADQLGLCRETRNLIHSLQPAPARPLHSSIQMLNTNTEHRDVANQSWSGSDLGPDIQVNMQQLAKMRS